MLDVYFAARYLQLRTVYRMMKRIELASDTAAASDAGSLMSWTCCLDEGYGLCVRSTINFV